LTLYMKINDRKQKIIQKIKRVNFRQKIEKIVETFTSLWRLVKWTKNKNHQMREVFKMLILKFNDLTTETFDEKAQMFKSVFFSTSSSIELDDISRSFYFRFIECSLSIRSERCWKLSNESLSIRSRVSMKSSTNCSRFVFSSWCNCSLRYSSFAYSKRIIQKRSKKSTSSRWRKSIKEITRFRRPIDRSRYWTSSKRFWNSSWANKFRE
jgi:wyosine [tRNA(Phe)-imidazoG37] synthetase (radical SAM superfamily)